MEWVWVGKGRRRGGRAVQPGRRVLTSHSFHPAASVGAPSSGRGVMGGRAGGAALLVVCRSTPMVVVLLARGTRPWLHLGLLRHGELLGLGLSAMRRMQEERRVSALACVEGEPGACMMRASACVPTVSQSEDEWE